ncbi:hypothetical protein JKP88DRAFT_260919 [Tribonema minus]|uniref:NAD-dependent epimerase/dehydratase domain-containing protein n=1 Tax=Tribonema minus TaxID=303371 RepID=A0A835ZQB3_9STRA|nr:hypothetical protein JKP88DRAFT_260919 [Tribonema minus]
MVAAWTQLGRCLTVGTLVAGVCGFIAAGRGLRMGNNDLYIVGAGYLGKRIGNQWQQLHPDAKVFGETRSEAKHEDLRAEGMEPVLRASRGVQKYTNVVFCAAPSGNDDYAGEVTAAARDLWNAEGTGCFVFTSSGGVYEEKEGGVVREVSPVGSSPRNMKLLQAEGACLEAGGCVVRLAGLYSLERGAHSFWLARGEVDASPDGLINLLSYDDAAGAVVATLEHSGRALTLLAGDDADPPLTRAQICEAALRHPLFAARAPPAFRQSAGSVDDRGKVYDGAATRRILGWAPRHKSFTEFIDEAVRQSNAAAAAGVTPLPIP